jgi:hypothetical protein
LLVTNDTGPMHAAAALGKPLVALFGPTEPRRTGPYGQLENVLRLDLPCSPCLKSAAILRSRTNACAPFPRRRCWRTFTNVWLKPPGHSPIAGQNVIAGDQLLLRPARRPTPR